MRITIVTDRYAPEARAAAYLARELAVGLANLGHDVAVLTRAPSQFVPQGDACASANVEMGGAVRVKRIRGISGSTRIWVRALDQLIVSIRIMLALLAAPKSDGLIVYSPPLLFSCVAVVQKWLRRWPYVLNLHDLYPKTAVDLGILRNPVLIWFARVVEASIYRSADRIVVAAPASKRVLTEENGIPPSRIDVVLNYVDTVACSPGPIENVFRRQYGIEGRFVVLYAGLMGLAQDLTPLIDAARRLQSDPDWVFILAGDGPYVSKWAELTRSLTNVRMIGPLAYHRYYEALRAADVCLVVLSPQFKAPAVPGKVATIMAAGRPMLAIVPEGNDTREILDAAGCGIATSSDPNEVLAALNYIKKHPDLRRRWGANGAAYATTHFDAKLAIGRFNTILAESVGSATLQRLRSEAIETNVR
jgi:colanic acid biosynthesis glycosyl transferase WcaI